MDNTKNITKSPNPTTDESPEKWKRMKVNHNQRQFVERNFLYKNREFLEKIMRENPTLGSSEANKNEMNIQVSRQLLKLQREKHKENHDVWIASTDLELACENISVAKEIIMLGCELLPNDEELWLKAVNMHEEDSPTVRNIIFRAIDMKPASAKLWLKAADLKIDEERAEVFRRAFIQNFNLESDTISATSDVFYGYERFLFGVLSIWPNEETESVLKDLLIEFPCKERLWLALVRFEGLKGNVDEVEQIIDRALITFADNDYGINNRTEWIKEAIVAEGLYKESAGKIMKAVMLIFKGDCLTFWIETVDYCISKNASECAYAIYDFLFRAFPRWTVTLLRIMFYQDKLGFINRNPNKKVLSCLIRAKVNWMLENFEDARGYFMEAFKENSYYKQVFRNVFLQFSLDDDKSRIVDGGSSSWRVLTRVKDALELNEPDTALELLNGYDNFTDFKLWTLKGQIEAQKKDYEAAKKSFENAIALKPNDIQLWLHLSEIEENCGNFSKARMVLEYGRKLQSADKQHALFFLAIIRLELRVKNKEAADEILSQLLENSRYSLLGEVWIEAITMEPRSTMGEKAVDALKKCENHRYVVLEVANLFFNQGNVVKCRKWFEKIVTTWPSFGDAWVYFYKLEKTYGKRRKVEDIKRRFAAASILYSGAVWVEYKEKSENRFLTDEDLLYEIEKKLPLPGTGVIKLALSSNKCDDHRCCY